LARASTITHTVMVDLTVPIETGMILAAFLFMRRMASLSAVRSMTGMFSEEDAARDPDAVSLRDVPSEIEVFEVYGTFFFGAASKFREALRRIEKPPKVLILRLREVHAIDATGLRALEELNDKNRRDGTTLLLSGLHPQPRAALERAGFLARLGDGNVLPDLDAALARGRDILAAAHS
jgi:SulP family sulfate permease